MKTTLDLPEDLLNEAMRETKIHTKTKVIIIALQELIRKSKISELKKFKGKVDLNIDLNAIDFQIINFTRPEGGRRISYTSTTDNTVKLFI